jgi:hypothetical protein
MQTDNMASLEYCFAQSFDKCSRYKQSFFTEWWIQNVDCDYKPIITVQRYCSVIVNITSYSHTSLMHLPKVKLNADNTGHLVWLMD